MSDSVITVKRRRTGRDSLQRSMQAVLREPSWACDLLGSGTVDQQSCDGADVRGRPSQLAERIKNDQALAKTIAANPSFNARAGGVLLKAKGAVIGAIGVGGARGSENDEACALAGVQAVQEQLATLSASSP